MLLLAAIVEPAYASDTDFLFQEPASMLCSLNNEFCKDDINNKNSEKIMPVEGGIFNVIDDALNNHAADVNVRMFMYRVAKKSDNAGFVAGEASRLNDAALSIRTTRETLGDKLKAGTITPEEYAFAIKKLGTEEKYNKKQAAEMAKIVRNDLKDVKLSNEFDKVIKAKEDGDKKAERNNEKETVSGTKGKEAVESGKSKTGEADSSEGKSKGESGDKSEGSEGESGEKSDSKGSSTDKSGTSSGGGSSSGGSSGSGSSGGSSGGSGGGRSGSGGGSSGSGSGDGGGSSGGSSGSSSSGGGGGSGGGSSGGGNSGGGSSGSGSGDGGGSSGGSSGSSSSGSGGGSGGGHGGGKGGN